MSQNVVLISQDISLTTFLLSLHTNDKIYLHFFPMFLVLLLAVLINYNMMSNSEVDFLTNNVRVLQSSKN